jgi:hypothetical protein
MAISVQEWRRRSVYSAAKPLTFSHFKRGVSMSSPAPNTTAAPASTATTATAATTTKKPASLKAVTGFGKLDPNVLVNTAHLVATGIGGHPEYFGNPPVVPEALDASATTLYNEILSAMDGGKNAKVVRNQQRKLVIQDLNLLAVYVQNVSNDDPAIRRKGFHSRLRKLFPDPLAITISNLACEASAARRIVKSKGVGQIGISHKSGCQLAGGGRPARGS